MSILIIDDSDSSRLLLAAMLREAGYGEPQSFASALDAFDYLDERYAATGEPGADLILMDIVMPDLDGLQATSRLKGDARYRDLPVIVVTVKDDVVSLERAFEAGATDYIGKPVNGMELRARVRSAIRLKREIDRRKAREAELEELTRKLEALSKLDGLTGTPNRRFFDEVFHREWLRGRRESRPLALLMLDIDFFKNYNDAYGHLQGDDCLRLTAKAIGQALRRPGDFMARLGGEEFAALLPDTDLEGALDVARAVRENLEEADMEHKASSVGPRVTVSIGLAVTTPDRDCAPELLAEAADRALYAAKRAGRDRVVAAPIEEDD